MHDAAEAVRASLDEECDNVARLSAYFGNVVLTHWQAAVLYARAYPHAAHVMVWGSWVSTAVPYPYRCARTGCLWAGHALWHVQFHGLSRAYHDLKVPTLGLKAAHTKHAGMLWQHTV